MNNKRIPVWFSSKYIYKHDRCRIRNRNFLHLTSFWVQGWTRVLQKGKQFIWIAGFTCSIVQLYTTKGSHWLSWSHHLERFTIATTTWLTDMEYLCHKCSTCQKHLPVLSRIPVWFSSKYIYRHDRCRIRNRNFLHLTSFWVQGWTWVLQKGKQFLLH
jgi:hypothetical protein